MRPLHRYKTATESLHCSAAHPQIATNRYTPPKGCSDVALRQSGNSMNATKQSHRLANKIGYMRGRSDGGVNIPLRCRYGSDKLRKWLEPVTPTV